MEIDYLPVTIDPILQLKTASYLNQWKTSFLAKTRKLIIRLNYYGTIWAGWPSPAEEELVDTLSLDEYLISNPPATILVRIKSHVLAFFGIHQGDLVLVERGKKPGYDDLALLQIEGEWVIRKVEKEHGMFHLISADGNKKPLPEQSVLHGVVIAVIRKYH